MNVRRIDEIINGRECQIEVARVAADRWRANLVRLYGGPSALMPFYGRTAEEAISLLTRWLTLAHRPRASSV